MCLSSKEATVSFVSLVRTVRAQLSIRGFLVLYLLSGRDGKVPRGTGGLRRRFFPYLNYICILEFT